jgi:caspase domain-containing protein
MNLKTLIIVLAFMLVAPAVAQEKPQIRALMVGVGAYQNSDAWSPLEGPPNDVQRLKKTLQDRFGTADDRLTVVEQESATRDGIQSAMLKLVEDAQPGETVIFFYAGHGFAVDNREPPEGSTYEKMDPEDDGLDECLVAVDATKPGSPGFADMVVRDDFVETILEKAVKKVRPDGKGNGSVIFLFDSCHSGTISRSAKALGKVERTNLKYRAAPKPPKLNNPAILEASRHGAGSTGWVVLSACGPRQTAKEDPSHGGDFTNALVTALEDPRLGPDSTYHDLMRLISTTPYFYDQSPVAEGDRDLVLFGGTAKPREASISVVQVRDKQVVLDRGKLLGLTPGTKVGLYRVGTKSAKETGNLLTEAVVQEEGTDLYRATAQVEKGDASDLRVAVGWVTEQNFGAVELPIYFDPEAEALSDLTEDPIVKKVSRGSEAAVLAWNDGGKLRLERSDGGVITAPTSEPAIIRRALRGEARRVYLTRMVNQPQSLKVELLPGSFPDGTISGFQPNDTQPDSDGLYAFGSGEQAMLKVTNESNQPLYISVLNFVPDGGVKVFYPYGVEMKKKLSPGQTLNVDISFDGGEGREGFKVLGTSEEVDLLFLETNGKERSAADPEASLNSPFGQLMGSVMTGTRASRPTIKEPGGYVAKEILWVNMK